MIKIWPQMNQEDVFVRAVEDGGELKIRLVRQSGDPVPYGDIAKISCNGVLEIYSAVSKTAAEAAGIKLDNTRTIVRDEI